MTTPAGLYNKYLITRTDGQPLHPEFEGFVLRLDEHGDPAHVAACRKAVMTYAKAIERTLPQLALDIMRRWDPVPEGWEHHIIERPADHLHFLVDKAAYHMLSARRVLFIVSSENLVRTVEQLLKQSLWHQLGRMPPAFERECMILPASGRLMRGLYPAETAHCVLIEDPLSSAFAKQEGDPRKMVNKRLMATDKAGWPVMISASPWRPEQ